MRNDVRALRHSPNRLRMLLPLLLALACLLAGGTAQAGGGGCPMCEASAAALGESGRATMNHGILFLFAVVGILLSGIGFLTWQRARNRP